MAVERSFSELRYTWRTQGLDQMQPKLIFLLVALALASPAAAADGWQEIVDDRFGYELQIPPAYELSMEAAAGASRVYHDPDGDLLAVWGGELHARDLKTEAALRRGKDEEAGWTITYERSTASWVSYSGVQGDQIRYVRGIRYCGDRAAFFLIDYDAAEKLRYDPIVTHMVRAFKATTRC